MGKTTETVNGRVLVLCAIMVLLSLAWWPFCAAVEAAGMQANMAALICFCLACAGGATLAVLVLLSRLSA